MEQRESPEGITALLARLRAGDSSARQLLWEEVERNVRAIAAQRLRREVERIDTTSLVHETYVRIFGGAELRLENRAHFFGAVARAMQQVLIRRAEDRRRRARPLDPDALASAIQSASASFEDAGELALLGAAMERLGERPRHARKVEVLRLHYFAGLPTSEIAGLFAISVDSVQRDLRLARAWLVRELKADRQG